MCCLKWSMSAPEESVWNWMISCSMDLLCSYEFSQGSQKYWFEFRTLVCCYIRRAKTRDQARVEFENTDSDAIFIGIASGQRDSLSIIFRQYRYSWNLGCIISESFLSIAPERSFCSECFCFVIEPWHVGMRSSRDTKTGWTSFLILSHRYFRRSCWHVPLPWDAMECER
jgi:hypothetical protein